MHEFADGAVDHDENILNNDFVGLHIKGSSVVESPAPTKPRVRKTRSELSVAGIREKTLTFTDESEAQASFLKCFGDVFIDSSRNEHSLTLCGKLAELAAGRLEGQRNCFLGLGARGIGKSQFFTALGDWFTRIGDSNSAFLYRQMGVTDNSSPFNTETTNVRKIIRYLALKLKWDNVPEESWENSTECMDWLLANNKRVFLVLDEFEQCYRVRNTAGLISELAEVGGDAGQRPLVIALLGSSSRLRSLCFNKGDPEEMEKAGFHGYAGAPNLNSTKFLPLIFSPITTAESTRQVLSCLVDVVPPLKDFDFARLCKASRGEVRAFKETFGRMKTHSVQDAFKVQRNEAWDYPVNKKILSIIWQGVQRSIQDCTLSHEHLSVVMNLSVEFTQQVQLPLSVSKETFIEAGISTSQLYQCGDESVIAFDGSKASFLHPADIECYISLFGNAPRTDGRLTLAEQISLLNANNASSDEVNERLVCESLCEHGIALEDLGHLKFASGSITAPECCHGVVRVEARRLTAAHDARDELLNQSFLGLHAFGGEGDNNAAAAHLRKEFPDELGGDLIAVFQVQGMESVRFIVVRVQIKLGISIKTNADESERTPIMKMMENERFFVEALGVTAEEVIFVRVLWSSQRTRATSDFTQHIIVIKSDDMMNYWIEPVKHFVQERRLSAYGFRPS
eukprot:gene10730-11915_t